MPLFWKSDISCLKVGTVVTLYAPLTIRFTLVVSFGRIRIPDLKVRCAGCIVWICDCAYGSKAAWTVSVGGVENSADATLIGDEGWGQDGLYL